MLKGRVGSSQIMKWADCFLNDPSAFSNLSNTFFFFCHFSSKQLRIFHCDAQQFGTEFYEGEFSMKWPGEVTGYPLSVLVSSSENSPLIYLYTENS